MMLIILIILLLITTNRITTNRITTNRITENVKPKVSKDSLNLTFEVLRNKTF